MPEIDLETALALAHAALAHARVHALAPLAVVVVDRGGRLRAALRENHGGPMGIEIALAKARGALAFGMSSRSIGEIFGKQHGVMASLAQTLQGQVLPIPGALLIYTADSGLLGAMGAAGDMPDRDESVVRAALIDAGLRAEPSGTHG